MNAHAKFGRLQRIIKGEEQVGEGLPRMRCKVCKYAMGNKRRQIKKKERKRKEKKRRKTEQGEAPR